MRVEEGYERTQRLDSMCEDISVAASCLFYLATHMSSNPLAC